MSGFFDTGYKILIAPDAGVFAGEHIPGGMFLGIYSGEMLTNEEADERGKLVHLLFLG